MSEEEARLEEGEAAVAEEAAEEVGDYRAFSVVADNVCRYRGSNRLVGRLRRIRHSVEATCKMPGSGSCVCWLRALVGDGVDRQVAAKLPQSCREALVCAAGPCSEYVFRERFQCW